MAKPPPRPRSQPIKIDGGPHDKAAGCALLPGERDAREPGLFDAPLPSWIKPCLPTLVEKQPVGSLRVHEIKWDGYRVSAYVGNDVVTIRTRNGDDWTTRFPNIAAGVGKLKVRSAVIDGEDRSRFLIAMRRPSRTPTRLGQLTAAPIIWAEEAALCGAGAVFAAYRNYAVAPGSG